jgi:hypothetical protein
MRIRSECPEHDHCAPRSERSWRQYGIVLGVFSLAVIGMAVGARPASAQTLDWDGETGIFVTPLAYTAPSTSKGLGAPVVAYHYLDAGDVIGGFHQASVTVGGFNAVEFGFTRSFHQDGSTAGVSNLWSEGFNTFHGKVNLVPEKAFKRKWQPAISVGFVVRTEVRNVGGVIQGKDSYNADFYAVGTKTVTKIQHLPLVLNLGIKATNASLLGLAGNATGYRGRAFGAAAFALKGPAKSTILLASEFMQEPRSIDGLPGAVLPTTVTYAIRIVPAGAIPSWRGWTDESPKFNIDLGVAQAAGNIMPGVDLHARHQFALGVSYGF